MVRLFSCRVPRSEVKVQIECQGKTFVDEPRAVDSLPVARPTPHPEPIEPDHSGQTAAVPLVRLAFGRSGDKGNNANMGSSPAGLSIAFYLEGLSPKVVARCFSIYLEGEVDDICCREFMQ
ncbi:MAG: hypothetical protein CM1200mP20_12950 [Pseudomonadota bacterium]|nr:MAG: hypothetical protein CM1200mP20_12950 [Pseudomonadota bacterium]